MHQIISQATVHKNIAKINPTAARLTSRVKASTKTGLMFDFRANLLQNFPLNSLLANLFSALKQSNCRDRVLIRVNGQSRDETGNVHVAPGAAVSWGRVDDHRIHFGDFLAADLQRFVRTGRSRLKQI